MAKSMIQKSARSFLKVKVNEEAVSGKEILNIATVDDHVTPPDKPEVPVVPEDPDQPNKPDVPVVPGKEVPNRPEPRKPAPKEKEARKSFLPKTGEEISYTLIALGGILVVIRNGRGSQEKKTMIRQNVKTE